MCHRSCLSHRCLHQKMTSLIKNIVYVIVEPKICIISVNSIKWKCIMIYRYCKTCSIMIKIVQSSLHNEAHDIFGQMPKIRNQISIAGLTIFLTFIFLLLFSYYCTLLICIKKRMFTRSTVLQEILDRSYDVHDIVFLYKQNLKEWWILSYEPRLIKYFDRNVHILRTLL